MIKQSFTLGAILFIIISLSSCGQADGQGSDYRLTLKIDDVTVSADDSIVAVPVYLSHPKDTLAGVEVHFRIKENPNIYFASAENGPDGLPLAADTAGSMLSGWEWIGITSLDSNVYDVRTVSLADWPNEVMTPPAIPADKELLMTLYLRMDKAHPVDETVTYEITVNSKKTSFADPTGSTIGMAKTMQKYCAQYVGDSCVSWRQKPVAGLDTTIASYQNGSITITK